MQTVLHPYSCVNRRYVLVLSKTKITEVGSRALSRFGVEDEQIYLVTRDHKAKHQNSPFKVSFDVLGSKKFCFRTTVSDGDMF
jgi:hypothetical protein